MVMLAPSPGTSKTRYAEPSSLNRDSGPAHEMKRDQERGINSPVGCAPLRTCLFGSGRFQIGFRVSGTDPTARRGVPEQVSRTGRRSRLAISPEPRAVSHGVQRIPQVVSPGSGANYLRFEAPPPRHAALRCGECREPEVARTGWAISLRRRPLRLPPLPRRRGPPRASRS